MKGHEDIYISKCLENNNNFKLKRKMISIGLKAEFNMLISFFKDPKILRTFFLREMHGFASVIRDDNKDSEFNNKYNFIIVFPKKKGQNLEIKEFMNDNINSNEFFYNNYVYKSEIQYLEEYENYKKILFKIIYINNKDYNNSSIINNTSNSFSKKLSKFIDSQLSFYIDIKDNSTVIINEFFYNINENEFSRAYEISYLFLEKLKNFFEKNFQIYFCYESTPINRSILQTFKYIMSRKIFYNKRFKMKEIEENDNEINIYVDVSDKLFPNSIYYTKCHILKLSDISCLVSIISLINVKYFRPNERFLTLKAAINLILKLLKKKIEKELIDS